MIHKLALRILHILTHFDSCPPFELAMRVDLTKVVKKSLIMKHFFNFIQNLMLVKAVSNSEKFVSEEIQMVEKS